MASHFDQARSGRPRLTPRKKTNGLQFAQAEKINLTHSKGGKHMVTRTSWTRRSILRATVGGAAVLGTNGLTRTIAAPYVLKKGSKLTFWGGLIFSDKANKLLSGHHQQHGALTTASQPKS